MPAGLRCTQLLPQASLLALLVLTCATFFGPLRAAEDPIVLPDAGSAALGPDDTLELTLTAQALGEEGLKRAAFGATNPALHAWLLESGQAPAAGNSGDGRAFVWPSPTRLGEWLVHLRGLDAPRTGPDAPKAWDLLLRWTWPDAPGGEVRLKQAVRFRVGLPDVVLLLDGSLSMGRNDPQRLRVEAARTFVNLALRSGGIGRVAVVQFDDKPRLLLPLTPVAERGRFELTFSELRELGMTDINGGIRTAVDLLAGREAEARAAVVLLTDGKQEPGEYAEAHQAAKQAGIPIHTVALGQSADRALLQRIAADTGGTCSDAESGQDLLHLYGTIAGRILGGRTLCEAALEPGAAGAGFPVDGSIRSLAASAKSEAPRRAAAERTGGPRDPQRGARARRSFPPDAAPGRVACELERPAERALRGRRPDPALPALLPRPPAPRRARRTRPRRPPCRPLPGRRNRAPARRGRAARTRARGRPRRAH
ncbi:MAG: VWA domain-containing protein [Planctomycetota bacterium]|nr:VWA domain-containing protein [Planctomycetota bacterium]